MALDFPSSPTNGQVYGNFIWSTAKGAWQAKPITGKVTTSATAPSAPSNGDEWFNTNDGNLYVYYTDVDGSQWVQLKSDATLSSTLGNRVEALETTKIGLVPLIPNSVTINAGTASVNAVGEISFTGGSSLTVNGIFSSTYRNYKIIWEVESTTAGCDIYMQFRNSGGTLGTAYYNFSAAVSTNSAFGGNYSANQGFANVGRANGVQGSIVVMDLINPGNTKIKRWTAQTVDSLLMRTSNGYNFTATAYTDLIIYPNGQNLTGGTMKVYGYN